MRRVNRRRVSALVNRLVRRREDCEDSRESDLAKSRKHEAGFSRRDREIVVLFRAESRGSRRFGAKGELLRDPRSFLGNLHSFTSPHVIKTRGRLSRRYQPRQSLITAQVRRTRSIYCNLRVLCTAENAIQRWNLIFRLPIGSRMSFSERDAPLSRSNILRAALIFGPSVRKRRVFGENFFVNFSRNHRKCISSLT